jgi:hypothetical protein
MKQKINKVPQNKTVQASLTSWSRALGIDRQQLQRALARSGTPVETRDTISARDIFNALTGDKEAAMTRKLLAEAEEKERDNRIATGDILTAEDADQKLGAVVTSLVQSLDSLPALVPGLNLEQRQILVAQIEAVKEKGRQA